MQVLLLEDIQNLGRAGDIVETSEGYARNFLFPQGKAALATQRVKTTKKVKDAVAQKRAKEELTAQQAIASKLENTELVVTQKVKQNDELYGSVTIKEIANLISKQTGTTISPKNITGKFPFKRLGSYPIIVELGQGVEFQMSVVVLSYEET